MSSRRDPRQRPTAHRPMRREGGRRSLSNVGGEVERWGDASLADVLAGAFAVRAGERDATLTHPFHAYPARLHPEVARRLVAYVVARATGARAAILDPCCGSGTVLIESMAAGASAVGTDLNPLAVELARIKTRLTNERDRVSMVETAHAISREAAARLRGRGRAPYPRDEARWYAPHTLNELAALVAIIDGMGPGFERDAVRMLLSSILVKMSRQNSDSDARWVERHVAPGAALHWFARKSLELARGLAALEAAAPRATPPPVVQVDDATSVKSVADRSIDAVITSPPYANTYDYVTHHARRYAWLRLDASALHEREMGAQRWFDVPEAGRLRFVRELASMCSAFARVLRPGGLALVVLGDGSVDNRAFAADEAITAAVRGTTLRVAARVSQARPTFDRTSAKAFAGRPKREHVIALERAQDT